MSRKEDIEKYKKRMKEITRDKDIISGIHNYCDRWCEKCTHTKHCSVFKMEQMDQEEWSKEDTDLNNQKFWDQLSLTFEATLDMITEEAERLGINIDEIAEQAKAEQAEKVEPQKTEVEILSYDYGTKFYKWMKDHKEFFEEKSQTMLSISDEKTIPITEALDVVNWYSIFISAKVQRAFHDPIIEFDDLIQNDNNGSAKIALIGIERSIEALSLLYKELQEKEDEILDFLVMLAKMKKLMEAQFPDAYKFIRPGFDA